MKLTWRGTKGEILCSEHEEIDMGNNGREKKWNRKKVVGDNILIKV